MKRGSVNRKLREEEQQAIGAIYKQYIDTFQENSEIPSKTFVKSETLYAEDGTQNSEKGQLYNPKPIIKLKKNEPIHKSKSPTSHFPTSGTKRAKKKSNLKALGDELKMLQHERQSKEVKLVVPRIEPSPSLTLSHDSEYANSTNLFVSNLSPHITEEHLIKMFGVHGPLASVKIMWPRNELCSRSANCGFVAFMSRVDAERALNALKNHQDMRINWGKSVKIPTHPVHIPSELYKLYSPPPQSGLPLNAQHTKRSFGTIPSLHFKNPKSFLESISELEPSVDLSQTTIKVTIPFDRNLLMVIHRTIEFVVREGPEFEALLTTIEIENPDFTFLRDLQNPAHTYYRWKLYSILNGDPKNSWSMKPFRMYRDGSVWMPPTAPNYKDGMPKELILSENQENTKLTEMQANRLVSLIKELTISRGSVAQVMIFCLNHAEAINDALDIVLDSLLNLDTNPVKKIARLYLLSDVLCNCKKRKMKVQKFIDSNSNQCLDIFKQFRMIYTKMNHNQDKDCLRTKIFMTLRSWAFHGLFQVKFITKLENIFLSGNESGDDDDNSLNDEPLDGANLLKRSLKVSTTDCTIIKKKKPEVDKSKKFFDIFNPCGNFGSESS